MWNKKYDIICFGLYNRMFFGTSLNFTVWIKNKTFCQKYYFVPQEKETHTSLQVWNDMWVSK